MQSPRRHPPDPSRAKRVNYTAMSVAFLSGAIFPVILHGLSLFFATFLPLIVFATGPFIIHLAALTTLVTANLLVGL